MEPQTKNPRYVAVITIIATSVIGFGVWLKPDKEPRVQPISEQEQMRLQKLVQKKALEDMATYFSDAAHTFANRVLRLDERKTSAVLWDRQDVLITAQASRPFPHFLEVSLGDARKLRAETLLARPDRPIAMVRAATETSSRSPAAARSNQLQPGRWLVAVWATGAGRHAFATGLYSETVSANCDGSPLQELVSDLNLRPGMLGGGLFDLDGNLAGVIVQCGDRYAAMAAENIEAELRRSDDFQGLLLSRYGMKCAPLDDVSRKYSQALRGVLVSELWTGYPADRAGLMPSDVILAIDTQPVDGLEALKALVVPDAAHKVELRVARRRKEISLELTRTPATGEHSGQPPAPPRLELDTSAEGYPVEYVVAGGAAAASGIPSGARVLLLDGAKVQNIEVARRRLARRREPIHLVLQQNGRRWAAFLQRQ